MANEDPSRLAQNARQFKGPLEKGYELYKYKIVARDVRIITFCLVTGNNALNCEAPESLGLTHLPRGRVSPKLRQVYVYNRPVQSLCSRRQCFVVKQNWDEITIILSNNLWEFRIWGTFCDVILSDLRHFDSFFHVHIKDWELSDWSTALPASTGSEFFTGAENALLFQIIRK